MNFYSSIPVGLNISEDLRLLSYLKTKYRPGYFQKAEIERLARFYKKDIRTFKKLLNSLLKTGLIGENKRTIFLRSWKFITQKLAIGTRAFRSSLNEIQEKKLFEAQLFSAKIDWLKKYFRKGNRRASELKGDSRIQSDSIPSGYLIEACSISAGKVSELKRLAVSNGFLTVTKSFTPICPGTAQEANILRDQIPGCFSKDGIIVRRTADGIHSMVSTYRIKNRRAIKCTAM